MSEGVFGRNEPSAFAVLADQFGRASLVVLVVVIAAWVFIKRSGEVDIASLPDLGVPTTTAVAAPTATQVDQLLERADSAFAAGRIIEPEFDNALAYYTAVESQDAGNARAAAGMERVIGYLVSQAEGAIYRNDWDGARVYARVITNARPDHAGAASILARADRLEKIDKGLMRALAQFSNGRLTAPAGDNAVETYRQILALDPGNTAATKGIQSVAERLIANAQSALFAGNSKQAENLMAQAKALNPNDAALKELERSARQQRVIAEDKSVQNDLAAASAALQQDKLMPPDEPNAYTLFSRVLDREPKSEAALRGLDLVRQGLIDRAERAMRANRLTEAGTALSLATDAGATEDQLAEVRAELGYQQRLADARAGKFDRVYAINELTARNRFIPEYPRSAASREVAGSVTMEFTVDEAGEVQDARVVESTNDMFNRIAVNAMSRWEFEPVLENDRPVPVRARIKFSFKP
jgi:TonB family protein